MVNCCCPPAGACWPEGFLPHSTCTTVRQYWHATSETPFCRTSGAPHFGHLCCVTFAIDDAIFHHSAVSGDEKRTPVCDGPGLAAEAEELATERFGAVHDAGREQDHELAALVARAAALV